VESLPGFFAPAFKRPRRQHRAQRSRRRSVNVLINGHLLAARARILYHLASDAARAPLLFRRHFEMRDVHWNSGLLANRESLFNRVRDFVPLVAHVRCVDAAMSGDDFRKLYYLSGLGVSARHIDEAG